MPIGTFPPGAGVGAGLECQTAAVHRRSPAVGCTTFFPMWNKKSCGAWGGVRIPHNLRRVWKRFWKHLLHFSTVLAAGVAAPIPYCRHTAPLRWVLLVQ